MPRAHDGELKPESQGWSLPRRSSPVRPQSQFAHHLCLAGAFSGPTLKTDAAIVGHEKVDTSVNVYTQVIDGAKLAAAQQVGGELNRN